MIKNSILDDIKKIISDRNSETQSILSNNNSGNTVQLTKFLEIPFGDRFIGVPLTQLGPNRFLLKKRADYKKIVDVCTDWITCNEDVDQPRYEFYIETRIKAKEGTLMEIFSPLKQVKTGSTKKRPRRQRRLNKIQEDLGMNTDRDNFSITPDKDSYRAFSTCKSVTKTMSTVANVVQKFGVPINGMDKLIKNMTLETKCVNGSSRYPSSKDTGPRFFIDEGDFD